MSEEDGVRRPPRSSKPLAVDELSRGGFDSLPSPPKKRSLGALIIFWQLREPTQAREWPIGDLAMSWLRLSSRQIS